MIPRIAVVILNYNGERYLEQFLPGVIKHSRDEGGAMQIDIIVADNASNDGSVQMLRGKFPTVKIIQLPSNDGYAGGYNNALKQIDARYYVLLNSDVEVTAGWIQPIIRMMEEDDTIAACQPKIRSFHMRDYFEYAGAAGGFIDRLGYPFCRGRIFDTVEKDSGQYDDAAEIFWASGACLFIRSTVFHDCGGFDSSFFAHMEEIDLCWRMKGLGHRVFYCPYSTVYHVGGGTLQKSNSHKTFLNFRNNLWMLRKNLPRSDYARVIFTRTFLDLLAAVKSLLSLQPGNFVAIVRAHFSKRHEAPGSVTKPPAVFPLAGVFTRSLVWQYYGKGRKIFSALTPDRFHRD